MSFDLQQAISAKSFPVPECGCWIWTFALRGDGYGAFHTRGKRQIAAHRASWLAHRGPIPDGMMVCHSCDIPSCVNPDHLFLGTAKDNANDRDRKGRTARLSGENASPAKLNAKQAELIYADDRPRGVIAAEYGVNPYTIYAIQVGKTWQAVTGGAARYRGLAVGARAGKAKLTPDQVNAIRADVRSLRAIARDYGVGSRSIHDIKSGRSWRSVK